MKTKAMLCAVLLSLGFSLTACEGVNEQVRELGAEGFEALEISSTTATYAAVRYLCDTARVKALEIVLPNDEQRQGRDMICKNRPVTSGLPLPPE